MAVLTTVFHRASITGVKDVGKNRRDNVISSFEKVLKSLFVLTAEPSLELVNFLSRCVTFSQRVRLLADRKRAQWRRTNVKKKNTTPEETLFKNTAVKRNF